ncbi:MAG: cupredoxin domain-containing protein [Halobacteriales archaeon]
MPLNRRTFLTYSTATLATIAGCAQAPDDGGQPSPTRSPTATRTPMSTPSPTANGEIVIEGSEWVLEPDRFVTPEGTSRSITFRNVGSIAHNLTIGAFPSSERDIAEQAADETFMAQSETIQPGETTSITVTPDRTGEFPYWCDVSGHRQAGMVGTMVVE